jgi:hypothetical protein
MLRIPDRFQGDGDLLTYDATTGEVIIAREAPKAVATAVFKDGKQREQALSAPAIVYRAANRSLEATGGAKAHVSIPLIAYGRKRDETPVPSDVFADQLTVWLTDPDTIGSSGTRVQEVLAEGHVHLTQPGGSGLVATHLRLDITKDETLIRGVPARLDITRHAEDRTFSEWVIATEITLSGSEVFLRGPVEARLHARPADLVMSLPGQRTPAPPENQGLTPVDITAAADLYLSEERILGRGGVVVVQGRPPLDGFRLAGDKVMLFLVPEAPLANAGLRARLRNLRVVRAVVEGSIQFKSADMDAQGDVLRLDRDEKIVSLYSHEGNAVLTFRGSYQGARPRFDLDLSDPENPRVISTLEPPDRAPR